MLKSPIKALKRKFKKHKKLFFVLLAIDILSIPAAAQMVDHVSFSVPQKVASVKLEVTKSGMQSFVVASNAPFAIISENAIGEFNVQIRTKDTINGLDVGGNAQFPGAHSSCAIANSIAPQKIYEAVRKTAKQRGEVISQAVIVDVRYDPALTPKFRVLTQKNAFEVSPAAQCDSV